MLQIRLTHADARIRNSSPTGNDSILHSFIIQAACNLSPNLVVLDGIAVNVQEELP